MYVTRRAKYVHKQFIIIMIKTRMLFFSERNKNT
jgi:hypothetical protein